MRSVRSAACRWIEHLDWQGPVFVISALEREGTEALSQAIMRYLDERDLRIAEDPAYAEALAELDRAYRGRGACPSAGAG